MKHIFFVSSNLTFFIADRVIQLDGLSREQCCLFMVRNYRLPTSYSSIYPHQIVTDYNVDPHTGRVFAGAKFWQTRRNIQAFDALIDPFLQGEEFIWYCPVCSNDICSLMVSRKECAGYYVIEDGLGSYRHFNPQTFTGFRYVLYKFLLKPIWPRIFCVKNHFITTDHPKFRGCIATYDKCFPMHQQYLRVIGNPFGNTKETNLPDVVISVDPWYDLLDHQQIEELYKRLSEVITERGYTRLACKFHPRFDAPQNAAFRTEYEDVLHRYFSNMEILPSDTILEQILCQPTQAFYSGLSSVALYVSMAGVKCYTFMPLVEGTKAWGDVTPILREVLEPINIKETRVLAQK